jgi:hypothetical protein
MSPLTATMSFLQRQTNNSHEIQEISMLTIKKGQNNIKLFLEVKERLPDKD